MCRSLAHPANRGGSPVHRLDPRTKLLGALLFIIAVSLSAPGKWLVLSVYFLAIVAFTVLSRVPAGNVARRSLVVLPFAIPATAVVPFFGGITLAATIAVKAWLCVLCLALVTETTTLESMLKGLARLHLPRVMVLILSFMYRYVFLLGEEAMRMKRARDSRGPAGNRLGQMRSLGGVIGVLFTRSYERGERVYSAMLSRGFTGQLRSLDTLRFRAADALCAAVLLAAVAGGVAVGAL